ncbi:MAG: DUF4124 domain-containing protein [Nitrospirae bacterium]|nr:DUF4124 domain-containing protein [Candidatus Troglogloeales bacterium]
MILRFSIFLIILLSFVPSETWGTVYKWTDENGIIHFSDNPQKVPEEYRGRVEKMTPPEKSKEREPPRKPTVLFEQKTDLHGKNKQWWQGLVKKWEKKKGEAENRIEELQIEIRQLEFNKKAFGGMEKEKSRLTRLIQVAELRKNVAIRMLTEGLPEEARKAGAPVEWLINKPQ